MRIVTLLMLSAMMLAPVARAADQPARDPAQEEKNKKFVVEFYDALFNKHDMSSIDRAIGPTYTQHNPAAADGTAALKAFLTPFFQAHPHTKSTITQVAADGDLVFLHVHSQADDADPGRAVVDIFRLKDGKIVEHWDVIQAVPDKSANGHGMF